MRTTIVLDDELLQKAQALTHVQEKSALIKEALKALIERESATRYTLEQTELRAPVDGTVTDLKIHTAGGVIGRITKVIDDSTIELEIADNVRIRAAKQFVSDLRSKSEPADEK
mgnify:CR=1 FL=1